jgi:hypothetical protein
MDPVPDPLLLRKCGSVGNRTRDLWACSQEPWPLDHRGGLPEGGAEPNMSWLRHSDRLLTSHIILQSSVNGAMHLKGLSTWIMDESNWSSWQMRRSRRFIQISVQFGYRFKFYNYNIAHMSIRCLAQNYLSSTLPLLTRTVCRLWYIALRSSKS